jgi:hypothetical protein
MIRRHGQTVIALMATVALFSCAISPPPTGWALTAVRTAEVMDVAAFNGRFVAIGSAADGSAAVWWSDDGAAWSASPDLLPDDGLSSPVAVAVGPPGIVVVGQWSDGVTLAMMAWHSADGQTWERVDTSAFDRHSDLAPGPVVWTGATFVALGRVPGKGLAAFTSPDGAAWGRGAPVIPLEAPDVFDAIVFDETMLVLVASGAIPAILRLSLGGTTWLSRRDLDGLGGYPDALVGYRDQIVLGGCREDRGDGSSTATAWLMDDAEATPRAISVAADDQEQNVPGTCIRDLVVHGDHLLAVGSLPSSAAVWRSEDGISWIDLGTYRTSALVMVTSLASDGVTAVAAGFDTVNLLDPQPQLVRWVGRVADRPAP